MIREFLFAYNRLCPYFENQVLSIDLSVFPLITHDQVVPREANKRYFLTIPIILFVQKYMCKKDVIFFIRIR